MRLFYVCAFFHAIWRTSHPLWTTNRSARRDVNSISELLSQSSVSPSTDAYTLNLTHKHIIRRMKNVLAAVSDEADID